MTAGKTIALTRHTFVDKVMSLPFNMLSRLAKTFLTRSKCLLILVAVSRGYSSMWHVGFSWWWLLLLWSTGSRA